MSHPQFDPYEDEPVPLAYDNSGAPPDLRQHSDYEISLMLHSERGGKERAYLSEVMRLRALVVKLQTRTP